MRNHIRIYCFIIIALLLTSGELDAKRVTLPRNKIDGKCVLKQSMFNKMADEYIVRNHYDLMGETITIPEGAKLVFKGSGSVANGTLIGQNSSLKANSNKIVFYDIRISGLWKVENIYSNWFDFGEKADDNTRNFQNMCSLTADEHKGVIHISEGDYPVALTSDNISCLKPNSNTEIVLDGNLLLQSNALKEYNIIDVSKKHSVSILGRGSVVGDVINHTGNEGEWGMGVNITTSRDVTLQDITIRNCWGDCIYIGQSKIALDDYSENVIIERVTCEAGRRQGLSLIAGKNIHVKHCKFTDTGKIKYTAPGRGVDIEPNNKDKTVVQGILIEDCVFSGNYNNNDFLTYNLKRDASIRVVRCKMDGIVSLIQNTYNVVIDSCEIHSLNYVNSPISNNIVRNTVFKSVKPNTNQPFKVKFENCEYPKEKTSALLLFPAGPLDYLKSNYKTFAYPVGVILLSVALYKAGRRWSS